MKKKDNSTAIKTAYNAIFEGIIQRTYLPGYHLREEVFSEILNISRTPVRQAIRQLAAEGLVDIKENRRSYVKDVSEENIEIIYDILANLESYSVGLVASRITPSQLDNIKRIQDQLEGVPAGDEQNFLALNARFHDGIHSLSGSRALQSWLKPILNYPLLCYLKAGQHTENETAARDHREIIKALETGDPTYAALRMRVHIESLRIEYRGLINSQKTENG